jgi:hypothetical protein
MWHLGKKWRTFVHFSIGMPCVSGHRAASEDTTTSVARVSAGDGNYTPSTMKPNRVPQRRMLPKVGTVLSAVITTRGNIRPACMLNLHHTLDVKDYE